MKIIRTFISSLVSALKWLMQLVRRLFTKEEVTLMEEMNLSLSKRGFYYLEEYKITGIEVKPIKEWLQNDKARHTLVVKTNIDVSNITQFRLEDKKLYKEKMVNTVIGILTKRGMHNKRIMSLTGEMIELAFMDSKLKVETAKNKKDNYVIMSSDGAWCMNRMADLIEKDMEVDDTLCFVKTIISTQLHTLSKVLLRSDEVICDEYITSNTVTKHKSKKYHITLRKNTCNNRVLYLRSTKHKTLLVVTNPKRQHFPHDIDEPMSYLGENYRFRTKEVQAKLLMSEVAVERVTPLREEDRQTDEEDEINGVGRIFVAMGTCVGKTTIQRLLKNRNVIDLESTFTPEEKRTEKQNRLVVDKQPGNLNSEEVIKAKRDNIKLYQRKIESTPDQAIILLHSISMVDMRIDNISFSIRLTKEAWKINAEERGVDRTQYSNVVQQQEKYINHKNRFEAIHNEAAIALVELLCQHRDEVVVISGEKWCVRGMMNKISKIRDEVRKMKFKKFILSEQRRKVISNKDHDSEDEKQNKFLKRKNATTDIEECSKTSTDSISTETDSSTESDSDEEETGSKFFRKTKK